MRRKIAWRCFRRFAQRSPPMASGSERPIYGQGSVSRLRQAVLKTRKTSMRRGLPRSGCWVARWIPWIPASLREREPPPPHDRFGPPVFAHDSWRISWRRQDNLATPPFAFGRFSRCDCGRERSSKRVGRSPAFRLCESYPRAGRGLRVLRGQARNCCVFCARSAT